MTVKGPEERGLMAVWPRALCLSSLSAGRAPLASLPSVPSGVCPPVSPPRPSGATAPLSESSAPLPPPLPSLVQSESAPQHDVTSLAGALKTLDLEAKSSAGASFDFVANEMTSYVDWVVKERERERERIAKERSEKSRRPTQEAAASSSARTAPQPTVPRLAPPAAASSTRLALPRQQGSATNPQGYYPSPPEFNSPTAGNVLNDAARAGAEVSPQVVTQPLDVARVAVETQVPSASEPPRSAELFPPVSMEVSMEAVTEDDFDFFDSGEPAPAPTVIQPSLVSPATTSHADGPTLNPPSAQDITNSIASHAHDESLTHHEPQQPASHSALPISPARTRPSSPLNNKALSASKSATPSPASDHIPLPAIEPSQTIPPDFPYRVKEHIPKPYLPIPVSTESVIADWKYCFPGSKYFTSVWSVVSSPQSAPAHLPELDEEETARAKIANEFIPSLTPITPSVPPTVPIPLKDFASTLLVNRTSGSKAPEEVEEARERKRAELRRVREIPARAGKFEIWHSKKFVHKFSTDTDPRLKHIKRLTGKKRNLEHSPYSYLRTEGDGDTRGTWRIWSEFRDTNPSDQVRVLFEEDDTDGEQDKNAIDDAPSPEETVVAPEPEEELEENGESRSARDVRTPPPPTAPSSVIVPYGATLLSTHFHPNHLFPLATPTSQTGSNQPVIANPPPAAISVPTPVSPAAHFAAGNGDGGSFIEAAVGVITREVIENPLWAEAYKATFGWASSLDKVKGTDVLGIMNAFAQTTGLAAHSKLLDVPKLDDAAEFGDARTSLSIMTPPAVTVGRNSAVWELSAPSLNFWEKLGLSPLNGPKHVVAFAMYDETTIEADQLPVISRWLSQVSKVYQARGFGTHLGGSTPSQYSDSLVPYQWETVKKTASNLIANLPSDAGHIVLYIISAPPTAHPSKEFKQLSSIITNMQPGVEGLDGRVLFHFVPRSLIFGPRARPYSRYSGLEHFVESVYDRLLTKQLRIVPRQIFKRQMLKTYRFTQAPAFSLARESPSYTFVLIDWPPAPVDAVDRHMMLQVAYALSTSREWLFMSVVDERGEGHEFGVRCLGPSDSDDSLFDKVAARVMTFTLEFSGRVNNEWNVVIMRSGSMEEAEVVAWEKCIHREITSQDSPIHVTIGCVEQSTPLFVFQPQLRSTKATAAITNATAHARIPFQDASSNSAVLILRQRSQLVGQDIHSTGPDSLVVSTDNEPVYPGVPSYAATPKPPQLGLRALCSSYVLHASPSTDHSVSITPGSADYPHSIASIPLHIFRVGSSPTSSFRKPLHTHLQDISRNYHDLSVLSRLRMANTTLGPLPFHVAAVETMKMALACVKDI